jgi:hypothetical protein
MPPAGRWATPSLTRYVSLAHCMPALARGPHVCNEARALAMGSYAQPDVRALPTRDNVEGR